MPRLPSGRFAEGIIETPMMLRLQGKTTGIVSRKEQRSVFDINWLFVFSKWVKAIRYFAPKKQLQVMFKREKTGQTTAIIQYRVEPNIARNFVRATSHGKFVWKNLYHIVYTIILTHKYRIVRIQGYGKGRGTLYNMRGPGIKRYMSWLQTQISKFFKSIKIRRKLRSRLNIRRIHYKP